MSNYYGVSDSLRIVSFAIYETILLSGSLLLMAFFLFRDSGPVSKL